jgi:hypothetical protein
MSERLVSIHRRPKSPLSSRFDRLKKAKTPTPSHPLIVSASELRDFMRCRVMHNLRHQARVEPKSGSVALGIGSVTHKMLETWNALPVKQRTQKRMEKIATGIVATTTRKELKLEDKELCVAMAVGYAGWTLDPENEMGDAAIGLVKCFPEEWFEMPLAKDSSIILRGKLDNRFISAVQKKTMAFTEYKTASQIKMSKFETNLQTTGYLCALRHLYRKDGFRRFTGYPTVLRKQMPGPRVKADLFAREPVERTDDDFDFWIEDA